jgi:hypothetical protein
LEVFHDLNAVTIARARAQLGLAVRRREPVDEGGRGRHIDVEMFRRIDQNDLVRIEQFAGRSGQRVAVEPRRILPDDAAD